MQLFIAKNFKKFKKLPSTFIQLFIIEFFFKKKSTNIYTIIHNEKNKKNFPTKFIQLLITKNEKKNTKREGKGRILP